MSDNTEARSAAEAGNSMTADSGSMEASAAENQEPAEKKDIAAKKRRAADVNLVALRMKQYHRGDMKKVQRFVRVYTLAKSIGELEKLSSDEQYCLELAAVVHNVEGEKIPAVRDILRSCDIAEATAMRVCHMVENAHNYEHIGTLDHQILAEAVMIVDFKDNNTPTHDIIRLAEDNFITNTGKLFLKRAFNI